MALSLNYSQSVPEAETSTLLQDIPDLPPPPAPRVLDSLLDEGIVSGVSLGLAEWSDSHSYSALAPCSFGRTAGRSNMAVHLQRTAESLGIKRAGGSRFGKHGQQAENK